MIDSIPWDGNKITKAGCYSGIPLSAYHSQDILDSPSVSSTGLRKCLEDNSGSPAHFFDTWSGNPDCAEPEDSKALALGRACHHLMLGQKHFREEYIIRPDEIVDPRTGEVHAWSGNRTLCRQWTAAAKASGRTILTTSDVESIKGMAVALGQNRYVRGGLLNGKIERSIFWKDKKTGWWIKVRPDAIPTDSGDFADLKTTTSTQYNDLVRTVTEYGYHQQAALVRQAALEVLKVPRDGFSFTLAFVTKKRPYCTRLVAVKDEYLALGDKQNRLALDLIARCHKDGRWPGPGDDRIAHIDVASWYAERVKETLASERDAA